MNCTLLNGRPVEGHVVLKHGDLITVVERSFRYEIIKSPIKQTTPIQAFKQTPVPGSKLVKQTTAEDAANGSSPSVHSPTVMKTPVKEEPQPINVTLSVPRSLAKASTSLEKEPIQKSSPSKGKSIADESPLALSSPGIQEPHIPSSPSSRSPGKDTFVIHDSAKSPIKLATTAPLEWKVEDNPFTVATFTTTSDATPTKSSVIESSPIKTVSPGILKEQRSTTPIQSPKVANSRRTPESVVVDHEITASPKLSPQIVRIDSPLTREDHQDFVEEQLEHNIVVEQFVEQVISQEMVSTTELTIVEQADTMTEPVDNQTIPLESFTQGTFLANQVDEEMPRMVTPEKLPVSKCESVVQSHPYTGTNVSGHVNLEQQHDVLVEQSQIYSQDFSEPPPFSQDSPYVVSHQSVMKDSDKVATPRTSSAHKLSSITKVTSRGEFTLTPSRNATHAVNDTPIIESKRTSTPMQTPKPNLSASHKGSPQIIDTSVDHSQAHPMTIDNTESVAKNYASATQPDIVENTPGKQSVVATRTNTPKSGTPIPATKMGATPLSQEVTPASIASPIVEHVVTPVSQTKGVAHQEEALNAPTPLQSSAKRTKISPAKLSATPVKMTNTPVKVTCEQEQVCEEHAPAVDVIPKSHLIVEQLPSEPIEVIETATSTSAIPTPRKFFEQEQARLVEIYQKQMSPRNVLSNTQIDKKDGNEHRILTEEVEPTNVVVKSVDVVQEPSADMTPTTITDNHMVEQSNKEVEQIGSIAVSSSTHTPRHSTRTRQSLPPSKVATPVPIVAVEEVKPVIGEEQQVVAEHEPEEQASETVIPEEPSIPATTKRTASRRGSKAPVEISSVADEPKTASKRTITRNSKTPAKHSEEESKPTIPKSTGRGTKGVVEEEPKAETSTVKKSKEEPPSVNDDQPRTATRGKRTVMNKKTPATKPSLKTQSTVKKAVVKSVQKAPPATAPGARRSRRQVAVKEEESGAEESVSPSLGAARRSKRNSAEAVVEEEPVPKRRSTRGNK